MQDQSPSLQPLRPVRAHIDTSAIRDNVARLDAHAAGAEVMAVVKSDGYGHGILPAARAALAGGATWLGVALVEEGITLRRAGIDAPVLVLSEPRDAAAADLLAAELTPTVYSPSFARALAEAAGGRRIGAHVKVDTGMRRVGIPEHAWRTDLADIAGIEGFDVTALWTHLAVADEPDNPFTDVQAQAFERATAVALEAGLRPQLRHACNSAGTILRPDLHLDLVRPGVAIYGMEPAPGVWLDGLRPALSMAAELTYVKPIAAGQAVSYGHRWAAPHDTVIGTVGLGYGDGVRRGLSNRGEVVVGGKADEGSSDEGRRVPIVGSVCMDQLLIDLGPDASEEPGDAVWLIGGPSPDAVSAADWARWLDTITYEVTCGLTGRLPRSYDDPPLHG